ncbi:MAG: amino acid permease, partial [Mycobacterium sp.]
MTATGGPSLGTADLTREDEGYHKSLKPRQLQMIAIGGAIGTGLFLGAGGRLASAGPGLFVVYGICGVFVFLILRAMGELVLHRPSSGSFVSYAREFLGEKAAYVAGWMYFLNWAMTAIVDSTAIATNFRFWKAFDAIPQWTIALIALGLVFAMNMVSVALFGEFEFWAALVKVVALLTFLVAGTIFLAGRYQIDGHSTGFSVLNSNGGLFPVGILPLVIVTSGVVFAYAAVELVGTAAGETAEPEKVMPRAINSVIARIALFYVGSLFLLALLLPYTDYSAFESPFVTFFGKIGIEGAGTVMNLVVLTAAFSSLNAGLYSTGRILRSMAMNGSAPRFTGRMSSRGVPYGGICLTAGIGLLGVILNGVVPAMAFEIVLNVASLGILSSWATIVICQIQLYRWSQQGRMTRPSFRMWGAPYTGYLTLAFLLAVLVLMGF